MFRNIQKYITRPERYAPSTNAFWDDEHISKGMLEAHLNLNWEAASRKHEFIDKSVAWITSVAPPSRYRYLLDLGCGPGLYAERFSNAGYSVTGIDFAKRSIRYATEQTGLNKSEIIYQYDNRTELRQCIWWKQMIYSATMCGITASQKRSYCLKLSLLVSENQSFMPTFPARTFQSQKKRFAGFLQNKSSTHRFSN